MADNVIESLELKVKSDANTAINNLGKLQTQLRHTAKSIGTLSSAVKGLEGVDLTFRRLGQVNINTLKSAVDQIERLTKLDLKKIDGKTISLEIRLAGADKAEREIYATQDAINKMDVSAFAKKFSDAFSIKGNTRRKITAEIQELFSHVTNPESGYAFDPHALWKVVSENGSIARSAFDQTIQGMKDEYKSFLDYVKEKPFHVSADAYRSEWKDKTFDQGVGRFFEKAQNSARILEADWTELTAKFPTLFTADDAAIANEENQIDTIIAKIHEAQDAINKKSLSLYTATDDKQIKTYFNNELMTTYLDMQEKFNGLVNESMRESAYKIPLDVDVDANRIETQIRNAIQQAAKIKYDLGVQFAVNTEDLKTKITTALGEINVSDMSEMAKQLKDASASLTSIGNINVKDTGAAQLVNSIRRLTEIDTSKFNAGAISEVAEAIHKIADVGDIMPKITRLVSAIARLASAGARTKLASQALSGLGDSIKLVVGKISSISQLPAELTAIVSVIANLANAGNKTSVTASNLGNLANALMGFMGVMQNAPQVSQNTIDMANALSQLASSGGKAGTAANSINRSISKVGQGSQTSHTRVQAVGDAIKNLGQIFEKTASLVKRGALKIVDSLRQIKNNAIGLDKATSSIKNMIGAMIGFRGITGLATMLKQTVMLGANMTEIDHIVESVFGNMSGSVDAWAKNAITNFGIAEHSAKQYAGVLSSMFQASGVGYKSAGKMAMDLVGLAGDLSAFYNEDTATSYEKIKSGLAGMVRPLRAYGIDLSAASLEEFRLAQGITTSYSAMTQAEKVMLRYQYLMANTKTQQGDFQRTNLSLANSLRTLRAYIQAVGTQLGVGLASAIRHIVVWLNTMMKYVLKAASAFATFMQTIFGKYKGGASGIAMENLADSMDYADGLGDAASNAADGLGNAANAAQELKKDLSELPFDELNQLNKDQQQASSGAGDVGGGAGGGIGDLANGDPFDLSDLLEESKTKLPDAISAWAQQIKTAFENHDWNTLGQVVAQGVNRGLQKLYDILDPEKVKKKVDPWINAFTTSFNSLIKWLDFDLLGRTIGRGINDIVYIMNTTLEDIHWHDLGSQIATGFNGLLDEVEWEEVGNLFGNKIMAFWNTLNGFVHDFEWEKLGSSLADLVNGLNEKLDFSVVADTLSTGINGIFTALGTFADETKWDEIATNVANGIVTFIETTNWEENGENLQKFITSLCDALVKAVDDVGEQKWEELGQGIATTLAGLPWIKILKTLGHVIVIALGGILKGMFSDPEGGFAATIILGLGLLKFKDSAFGKLAGNIVKVITGKSFGDIIRGGFSKAFHKGVTDASTSDTVTTAAEKAGTSIGTKIATKIGAFFESEAGATLISSGLLTAIASLPFVVQGLDKQLEKSRGGNGIQTSMGTGWDEYINQLLQLGQLDEQHADALFQTKEQYELMGKTADETYDILNKQLMGYVGSQEEATAVINRMTQSGQGQQEMYAAIQRSQANATYTQKGLNDAMIVGAQDVNTYKNDLSKALNILMATTDAQDQSSASFSYARTNLQAHYGELNTLSGAYEAVSEYIRQSGGDVEAFNNILKTEFGYTSEAVQQTSRDAEEASNKGTASISKLNTHLQAKSQLMRDDLFKTGKEMRNVGDDSKGMEVTTAAHITGLAGKMATFAQNVKTHLTGVESKTNDQPKAWGNVVSAVASFASDTKKNLNDTESETSKWKTNSNKHLEDYDKSYSKTKSSTIASMLAIIAQTLLTNAANASMASSAESSANRISKAFSDSFTSTSNSANTFVRNFSDSMQQVVSVTSALAGQIQASLSWSMYQAGQSAGYSFANGFSSVHIPVPYLTVNFVEIDLGIFKFTAPQFGIGWYRSGGLFMGGNGQIIGIGEDNRDEAVLPLEDRRAMARIGSAIAEASGNSFGMSEDMADRIAERMVEAMISNDDRREIIVNAVLKTESDEVLARAVTRGQQKLDYRNNPTPQFAY